MIPPTDGEVIAAVATPPGRGAIGVVRLSGDGAAAVLSRVFQPAKAPEQWISHQLYHGWIYDVGVPKDEVLCCVMRGPRSYTREDVVEIYAHGGTSSLRGVLEAVLHHGARPAEPGEFTKRAFVNGRMDLTQAEAVMALINAKTDAARRAGLRQLGGGLSERIKRYRETLLSWLAHIELSIDYPEHESEAKNRETIHTEGLTLLRDMENLLDTAQVGRILTEGVRTAIVGRPNVGKSSLMNAILREDRAIVTDIPGTTRDVLSEPVSMRGVPLLLMDTAGIRETEDIIEKLGVDKSVEQAEAADLILLVADYSQPPHPQDQAIYDRFCHKNVLWVLNKSDLPPAPGWPELGAPDEGPPAVPVSARFHTGLDQLYRKVEAMFLAGMESDAAEADILTKERHRLLLEQAVGRLRAALTAIAAGLPEDLVSMDLTAAYRTLGEMIGEAVGEDIVDRIFSEFCVGK